MTVLHVVTQNEAGGAQRIAEQLVSGAVERGMNAKMVFLYKKRGWYSGSYVENIIDDHHISLFGRILSFIYFYTYCVKVKPKAIYLHTHYSIIYGVFLRLLCPNVFAVHHGVPSSYNPYVKFMICMFSSFFAYNRIICVSRLVKSELLYYPRWVRSRILVIYNVVQLSPVVESIPSFKQEFDNGKRIILCVGRLNVKKNQPFLFDVMRLLSEDYVLFLVGDGELREEYIKMVNKMELNHRIFFLGEISRPQLSYCLSNCYLFAFPSVEESFGLSPLEAAFFTKPIISNDLPAVREILDGYAAFINVTTPDEWSAEIERTDVSSNSERFKFFNRSFFDEKRMLDEYYELIRY